MDILTRSCGADGTRLLPHPSGSAKMERQAVLWAQARQPTPLVPGRLIPIDKVGDGAPSTGCLPTAEEETKPFAAPSGDRAEGRPPLGHSIPFLVY